MGGWLLRGDTIINDLQYKKLYWRAFEEPQSDVIISQYLFGFLREDVENKTVYAIEIFPGYPGCDSVNEEYVLFDFSYEVGDTSQLCLHTEYLGPEVLSEIQNYWVFGKDRNVYVYNGACVDLIEGVGHYQGLMESPVINISGGIITSLFDYCRGTDEECGVIYVNVDEYPSTDYFSVYPNPAVDQVRCEFTTMPQSFNRSVDIAVKDVYGRLALQINGLLADKGLIINISNIPAGLYFISLNIDEKVVATRKLIISR